MGKCKFKDSVETVQYTVDIIGQSLEDITAVLPFLSSTENGVHCTGSPENTTWVLDHRQTDSNVHWDGHLGFEISMFVSCFIYILFPS